MTGYCSFFYLGKNFIKQLVRSRNRFFVKRPRSIIIRNWDSLLTDNVSIVSPGRHIMKGNPGFFLAVDQHPVYRTTSPVFGEKRSVKVEASSGWDGEDGRTNKMSVIKRKNNVRRELLNLFYPEEVVDIIGRVHQKIMARGALGNRTKPNGFLRIILMGKNRGNLEPVSYQSINADTTDIMVG
jgi:hypothetical protein